MRYIGIDPGASGGIAVIEGNGTVISAVKMPETERDIFDHLIAIRIADDLGVTATLEHVHAMPHSQMGMIGSFKLGKSYGAMLMALSAAGISFSEVSPRKWQGYFSCLTGGDKKVSYRKAQQMFPAVRITHAIADALLIAEYGRRIHVGYKRAAFELTA